MTRRIYLDANVFMDYFLKGSGFDADCAFEVLRRTVLCEFIIIVSDVLLLELEKHIPKQSLKEALLWLQPKIETCRLTHNDKAVAHTIKIHKPDCYHVALARRMNATLISRDKEMIDQGAIPTHTL